MQNIIYLDVLIITNTLITFLILLATSDLLKTELKKIKAILASLTGGILSALILLPELNPLLTIIIKLLVCIIIIRIAFRFRGISFFIKSVTYLFTITALIGGTTYIILFTVKGNAFIVNNGYFYFDINAICLASIIGIIIAVIKIFNNVFNKIHIQDIIFDVKITYSDKSFIVKALFDTGNNVTDIFTGNNVILISIDNIKEIFDNSKYLQIKNCLEKNNCFENLPEKFRLLPIRAVSCEKLLPAFTADKAEISNASFSKIVKKPTIVITDNCFKNQKYSSLINKSLIGEYIL